LGHSASPLRSLLNMGRVAGIMVKKLTVSLVFCRQAFPEYR
jgi:hypothetical protein